MSDLMKLDFRPDEGSDASMLDEFVITGAHGIHAEMMNDKHLWIGIENEAGHLVHVNVRLEGKGRKAVLVMRAQDQGVHPRKGPPPGWVAVQDRIADLADPIAVHRNMLAGTIAKPSVEAIIHVYGHKALNAALRETDGVPPLTDTQQKGSETP